jgi:hypothetical protein
MSEGQSDAGQRFQLLHILRALAAENDKLDARHRVTIDSIRNHCVRHFPVRNVARATYRDIPERRAKENGVDFVEGVATAITPMALFETIMVKDYQTLVDPYTKIDVNTAMIAAGRLQSLIDTRAGQPDIVDMLVQMNRIISAVKSTVPESMWPGSRASLRVRTRPRSGNDWLVRIFIPGIKTPTWARCRHCVPPSAPPRAATSTSDPTASKKHVATRKWWPPAPSLTTSSCSGGCGRSPKNSPG